MPADATDIGYVRLRLARVFARRPVLPYHGLQYRLTEVGPIRFSPPALDRALHQLNATSAGPSRPRDGLYADPTLDARVLDSLSQGALDTIRDLTTLDYRGLVEDMANAVGRTLKNKEEPHWADDMPSTQIAGGMNVPRPSVVLRIRSTTGIPITCWVTHELPWLHPDDKRFWSVLVAALADWT